MNAKYLPLLTFTILILLVGLACSLTSEVPPTLAPSTPLSTITPDDTVLRPPTVPPQQQAFNVTPPSSNLAPPIATPVQITRPVSLDQIDSGRMMQHINSLVGFESRHILSSSAPNTGINAAKTYLLTEMQAVKESSPFPDIQIDVYEHQFLMEWGGQTIYPSNLVMAVTGTDRDAGVVILTAHYDSVSAGDWYQGDNYQPGANDNASGVTAILELARVTVQERHRATIVFVLFTAEETGRQGSKEFVEQYIKPQNIPVVAVFNMDIIGSPEGRRGERYDNELRIYSQGPNETANSRQLARMVAFAASRYTPEMVVNVEDLLDRSGRWGDHQSFSDLGYPAIRVIEAADDATVAHTTRDTPDRIDPTYLKRTTQVVMAGLELMADGPNAPTLKPLRPSETDASNLVLEWSHNPFCQTYIIALRRAGSLTYDEFHSAQGVTSVSWGEFKNYESVTVGCIDFDGQLGRFAPELAIPN